jgi:two-component system response regulator MprA
VTSTVLLADDDRAIRDSLVRAMELEGYRVIPVPNGVQALNEVRRSGVDAAVVDVMMPGVDGLDVCRLLRADGYRTPILLLTARSETSDRVEGLDAGADDYLVKPFELDELLARLRALLRRVDVPPEANRVLHVSDLRLDPAARRVWRGDTALKLSKTEFDLLELLVRNAGIVLDHATIYDRIWGYDFGVESKNLAVYVGYLRRKVGMPSLIHTVRGVGYSVREA